MEETERLAKIEETVAPLVRSRGLQLVDLELRREGRRLALRVFVDRPGGASLQDCERVSREAGDVLEVGGLMSEPYDLMVSTPGLDRILRKDREFLWARGKLLRCWVRAGTEERTELRGRLVDVQGDRLILETEAGAVEVSRQSVTKARLEAEVPWPRRML